MEKTVKRQWIIVNSKNMPLIWTMAYKRTDAIGLFNTEGWTRWPEARRKGFRAVKVNVTFEEVK